MLTFSFEHKMNALNGHALIEIREESEVLSEKSLYGAGTTRYTSTETISFIEKSGEKNVIHVRNFDHGNHIVFSDKSNEEILKTLENNMMDMLVGNLLAGISCECDEHEYS